MGIFYSPTTNSFFDEDIHGPRERAAEQSKAERKAGKRPRMIENPDCMIPADAKCISPVEHAKLMAQLAEGRMLANDRGRPKAVWPPHDPQRARDANRKKRDRLLGESDWTQLPDTLADDSETKAAWAVYRQSLRDLDLDNPDWPARPGLGEEEEE